MPEFRYRAYGPTGALERGEISSMSRDAAIAMLSARGAFPLEVDEAKPAAAAPWWNREIGGSARLSSADLALFTRELATLVKAEIPLDDSLRLVSLQPMLGANMRSLTSNLHSAVREGRSLSEAIALQNGAFPEFTWRLIQAGEASGALGNVLDDMAQFLERSSDVKGQIFSALLYPMILIAAAIAALAVIMNVLLPTIVPLFKDAGATPPAIIALLVQIHAVLSAHWPVVAASILAIIICVVAALRTASVRAAIDRAVLRLPVIGRLVAYRETARFSGTLATLVRNGVPMLDAVRISGAVLSNRTFSNAVAAAGDDIKEGTTLSQPLLVSGVFPELALRLIAIGEQTGQLDVMLQRVSAIHDATLQRQVARYTSLLTPILTLVIGLLVGGLIISVMGAILSVNDLAFQ